MDGEGIFVQAHWPTEILSALLQGKRRGRIGSTGIQRFLVNLSSLRILVEESFVVMRMEELLKLSDLHEVTA